MSLIDTLFAGAVSWAQDVTQPFGPSTLSGEPAWGGYAHFHEGIDIGVPVGTPLHSPVTGTVVTAGLQDFGGGTNVVTVRAPDGSTYSLYHLSSVLVSVGQSIAAGDLLGASGGAPGDYGAGYSTGPHVHFQIGDSSGNWVDPETWTPGSGVGTTPAPGSGGTVPTIPVSVVGNAAQSIMDKLREYAPALLMAILGIGLVAVGALNWSSHSKTVKTVTGAMP